MSFFETQCSNTTQLLYVLLNALVITRMGSSTEYDVILNVCWLLKHPKEASVFVGNGPIVYCYS